MQCMIVQNGHLFKVFAELHNDGIISAQEHRLISERVWNKLQRKLGRCGEENIFVKLGNSTSPVVAVQGLGIYLRKEVTIQPAYGGMPSKTSMPVRISYAIFIWLKVVKCCLIKTV